MTDEPINEYKVKISIRNNLILKAIDKAGYNSVASFCRAAKIAQSPVIAMVAMREAPLTKAGEFSKTAKVLMEELCALPTELWTPEQLTLKLRSNTISKDVSADGMRAALGINADEVLQLVDNQNPEDRVADSELATVIDEMLEGLAPREAKVLRLRYGLGCEEHTLEETGTKFEVTRERIRQIEAKALRKLKHPSRSEKLREQAAGRWA